VIDSGRTRDGKSAAESQMILNHRDALDYLIKEPDHASLNSDTIIALHAFLSSGLIADPRGCGRLRSAAISISNTVYSPPSDPKRIESLFANVIGRAAQIRDPFEQAFFLLVHLSYLQPFESVNKRIARLAANVPLIQANLCPLTFVSVSDEAYAEGLLGVFELNRVELLLDFFIDAYEKSCNAYLAVSTTDDFSLKYRDLVRAVVTIMLRHGQQASEEAVRHCIPSAVPKEDQDKFVGLILSEFQSMHAGNAIRFGLKPSEFLAWQQTALKNAKSN
jgi:Fic family protein